MSSRSLLSIAATIAFLLPSAAPAQSPAAAGLTQKLNASFSLTQTGWGSAGRITNPGGVYIVHVDGLFARAIADHVTPTTTIINGKPLPAAKGFKGAFGTFGDTQQIKPGERFYLHEGKVNDDAIVFNFISLDSYLVVNGDGGSSRSRLRMYVRFPIAKEQQATLALADIHRLVDPVVSLEDSSAPIPSVQLGENRADVEKALGRPDQIVDLGAKKILVYKSVKITLVDDKVTDAS